MLARRSFLVITCVLAATCGNVDAPSQSPPERRPAAALAAEETFWDGLLRGRESVAAAERALEVTLAQAPGDARTHLLYGMLQLWVLAEQPPPDHQTKLARLDLAIEHLERYRTLHPDERVTSWIEPARIRRAQLLQQPAEADAAMRRLVAAAAGKPYFHSFAIGLASFERPAASCPNLDENSDCAAPGLGDFCRGLCALKKNDRCAGNRLLEGCRAGELWPHSAEGFLLFSSDYLLKAGRTGEAIGRLEAIKSMPRYAEWPYKDEIEWRKRDIAAHAARVASSAPMPAMPGEASRACRVCHRN